MQTIDFHPPTPAVIATTQTSGSVGGANLSLPAGTSSATTSGTITTGSFKFGRKGKHKLHLNWSKYARGLLKHDHDKLTALLLLKGKAGKAHFSTDSTLRIRR